MHHNTRCMHACMHACPSSFVPVFPFAVTLRATWQVEMLRKLILTVALAALYKGEPPQLGGSLFAIFCFYSGHLLLKPYLNQGLNVFQRTSVSPCLCGFPSTLRLSLSAGCALARTCCRCESLALTISTVQVSH
jgi:hypothetical protein